MVAEVEGRMVGRIIELPLVAAAALEALILFLNCVWVCVCRMRSVRGELLCLLLKLWLKGREDGFGMKDAE